MDESKEQETVVTTSRAETVVSKVVVEENQELVVVSEKGFVGEKVDGGGGGCDGDVFVEVLGSEVLVDGVTQGSGKMGTVEFCGEHHGEGGGVDGLGVGGAEDLESGLKDECVRKSSSSGNSEVCGNVDKEKIAEAAVDNVNRKKDVEAVVDNVEKGKIAEAVVDNVDKERIVVAAVNNVDKEKVAEAVVKLEGNGNDLSSCTGEVKSKDIGVRVCDSVTGISSSGDGKADFSTERAVESEEGGFKDRPFFGMESGLSNLDSSKEGDVQGVAGAGAQSPSIDGKADLCEERRQDSSKEGDVQGVFEAGAQSPGSKVLDQALNGSVECNEAQNILLKTTCVEYVQGSSEKLSTLGPVKEVPVEEAQAVEMNTDDAADSNFDENTKPSGFVGSDFVDKQMVEADHKVENMDERLDMGSSMMELEVPHGSNTCSLPADAHTGVEQGLNKESEGHTTLEQLSLPDDLDIGKCVVPQPECKSDTSLIGRLDKVVTADVSQIGPKKEYNKEVRGVVHNEQVFSNTSNTVEPDSSVASMNASPNEDESANLSNPKFYAADDVPHTGLIVKAIQDVQVEPFVTDKIVSMDKLHMEEETDCVFDHASCTVQVGSHVNRINAEQAVSAGNAAPDRDETSISLDPLALASADSQGQIYMADEDLDLSPPLTETAAADVSTSSAEADQDFGPTHDGNVGFEVHNAHELPSCPIQSRGKGDGQGLEQRDTDYVVDTAQSGSAEDQVVNEEPVSDSAKSRNKEIKNAKHASSKSGILFKDHRVSYQLPLDNEGDFSVFNLVWGKVKSHPWWPGQIFHSSDSSEKAMKYYKKDCYLVAYFGDRTFAWNEASVLKPFREHFSLAARQNNTETFKNAVKCALAEVSRRTELGLACSCISVETYDKIKYQIVENAGIREESSKREGVDRCTVADCFQPDKLVEYMRSLAVFPTCSFDQLELTIAKAQLLASRRLKGVDALADFDYYEGLKEGNFDTQTTDKGISGEVGNDGSTTRAEANNKLKGPKRKHNLKDIVYQRRKEKSMTELMDETMYYLDGEFDSHEEDDNLLTSTSGVKRKAGFLTADFPSQQNTKTISLAKVSHTASSNAKQSFKVGECISRVASQLTGSPLMKGGNDGSSDKDLGHDSSEVPGSLDDSETDVSESQSQQSSLEEMLSQLCLSAQTPMKGYSFLGNICSFFAEFRNFAVSTQRQKLRRKGRSRKPKSPAPVVKLPDASGYERNDSYWTDMVVQNTAEAKTPRRARKRKDDQPVSAGSNKPPQSTPRRSRKVFSYGTPGSAAEVPSVDQKQQDQLPTELLLSFVEKSSIPSEVNLNRMFKRFGILRESDTEVDRESNRARVVFKKRSDAEVAYSSAAMFNIFGSTPVNYQLSYTPSLSIKTPLLPLTEGPKNTI